MIRLLLLSLLILVGCGKNRCPELTEGSFLYNEDVKIISGFYKGRAGLIKGPLLYQKEINGNFCSLRGYEVIINDTSLMGFTTVKVLETDMVKFDDK